MTHIILLHFTTFASLCLAFLKMWDFAFLYKKYFYAHKLFGEFSF